MTDQPTLPPDVVKMKADFAAIREGILQVTFSWAALENSMAVLLEAIVGNQQKAIGCAIYFAPGGAETRFDIVDRAFLTFIQGEPRADTIFNEWVHFMKKLSKSRLKRNAIIHGNVITYSAFGKNHARLSPPIFDFARMNHGSPQLPGLSANEVGTIAAQMWHLGKWVLVFNQIVTALKQSDAPTLPQRLREAEECRLTWPGRQSCGQTPPEPKAPRQS
jgi:hypothetical protein